MNDFSVNEVLDYVREDDVKFIRIAFCDVFGKQKNVSIMPEELPRAFQYGIAFDGSAIPGFGSQTHSDLFLHPDPKTLSLLPWRPEHGKVVRMFSSITYPDGHPFACDTRTLLQQAVQEAEAAGYRFFFGAEQEFYLFLLDQTGAPTQIPYDDAGYMDIAPDDRGENIRREICLTLEQMGIRPESSHHEEGPGQNEIDFRYSDALTAADQAVTFRAVVKTIARQSGLTADFSPKPLPRSPGNGFHINLSVQAANGQDVLKETIAGIMEKVREITAFLNPVEGSYQRFGGSKAPGYVSWSSENRSQLIRIPAAFGEYRRAELRSPDPAANPYLAFTLLIYAGLYGIQNRAALPPAADFNLYNASPQQLAGFQKLPQTLEEARRLAAQSEFVRQHLPKGILEAYCGLQ